MNEEFSKDFIDSWKGGTAIFFEYRCSLAYFRIAVTSNSKSGCLDIQCLETTYIKGKTRWTNFNLEVKETNYKTEEGFPVKFVLTDENADVEIHCGLISVNELNDFNDLVPNFDVQSNERRKR